MHVSSMWNSQRRKKTILLEHVVNSKAEAGMRGIAEHQGCFWTQITEGPTICVPHIWKPESVHKRVFGRTDEFTDGMQTYIVISYLEKMLAVKYSPFKKPDVLKMMCLEKISHGTLMYVCLYMIINSLYSKIIFHD